MRYDARRWWGCVPVGEFCYLFRLLVLPDGNKVTRFNHSQQLWACIDVASCEIRSLTSAVVQVSLTVKDLKSVNCACEVTALVRFTRTMILGCQLWLT